MRHLGTLLTAIVLTVALAAPAAAGTRQPALYLALGDSLAWGDGASVPDATGYVPLLAEYFEGTAHGGVTDLVNLSVRGAKTQDLISGQLTEALERIADPATDKRIVTISIGGNNMLDLINSPSDPCLQAPMPPECQLLIGGAMAQVAADMPVIMATLAAALAAEDAAGEKVFVALPYNALDGTGNPLADMVALVERGADGALSGCSGPQETIGLDDVLACSAAAFGGIPVDLYPVFAGRTLELTHMGEGFNVHPNDDGYALIAKAHRLAGDD